MAVHGRCSISSKVRTFVSEFVWLPIYVAVLIKTCFVCGKLDRRFDANNICDDWGRRYERELNESIQSMPGSFPGARIDEVS